MSHNKVVIDSPTHKGVQYKYLLTDKQLVIYNELTINGTHITLGVFSQLGMKGLLNKRYIEDVTQIKIN